MATDTEPAKEMQSNQPDSLTMADMLGGILKMQKEHTDLERQRVAMERRSNKIKNIFWIIMMLAPVALTVLLALQASGKLEISGVNKDYVSVIRINGGITPSEPANAANLVKAIRKAYNDEDAKGVVITINSPGGTPAQAEIIYSTIVKERSSHPDMPTMVVGEDMLTSGAYYVASAADRIYVNKHTMAGSIGVVMEDFDMSELVTRYGIKRRIITAGEHKRRMDRYRPMAEEDIQKYKHLLTEIHTSFIEDVQAGRGKRLKGSPEELFSGDVWVGDRAVELGLADGVSNFYEVLDLEFGVEEFVDYTPAVSIFETLSHKVMMTLSRALSGFGATASIEPQL